MAEIDLSGQVVIVSGGGRRLGRMHCRSLAAAGASVVVNDVDEGPAARVVEEIESVGGRAAMAIASVMTRDGAQSIVNVAVETFGTVDVVVNNAGFMRSAFFEDLTEEMFQEVMVVHVGGSFHLSQAAWPILKQKGYGRIVMTSSAGGMFATKGEANYAAAKAGLYGFTRALSFEGENHGIKVNCILPHGNPLSDDNRGMDADENKEWHLKNWDVPEAQKYLDKELLASFARRKASMVSPMLVYLSSRSCAVSGEAFAAGFGRYARVFVGETFGWSSEGEAATPADIARNLEAIRSTEEFAIPSDMYEEMRFLGRGDGADSSSDRKK
ncbi:MAG: SDR family NAD(P)-dependent oxidoreductase [Acidimicrobiia bacterium]|nr:SDR family NAD(P)-dependent oxidoreductase [Acidimicrobiia bacterium]